MPTYSKETALYDTGAISTDITEAGQTAGRYITAIDNSGIKVHAESNPNVNYSKIDGDGLEVFKGTSISDSKSVAKFSDESRVGAETGENIRIDSNSMSVRNGTRNIATFGDTGTHYYSTDSDVAEQVAEIAYGDVWTDSAAGEKGPYFTFGNRATGSIGKNSLSVGANNIVSARNSAAFGSLNNIKPTYATSLMGNSDCIALGIGLTLNYSQQIAIGTYNNNNSNNALEIGSGTASNARKNAFEVRKDGHIRCNELNPFTTFTATGTVTLSANSGESLTVTGTVPTGYTPIAVQGIETAHNQTCLIGKFVLTSNGASITLRNVSSSKYTNMSVTATILCTSLQ